MICFSIIGILFLFVVGYSAFSSDFMVSGKGTIVENYPKDGLLLHLDVLNRGEDLLKWKDLSPNKNDCALRNFDNTTSSGWQEKSLVFDGIDDNVLCGEINPDNFTLIITAKILSFMGGDINHMLGNWEYGGYGIAIKDGTVYSEVNVTNRGYVSPPEIPFNYNDSYIFIQTYNGQNISFSVNDIVQTKEAIGTINPPLENTHVMIGGNPQGTNLSSLKLSNIEVYSVLIYDHVLSDEQIAKIKDLEKAKYKI